MHRKTFVHLVLIGILSVAGRTFIARAQSTPGFILQTSFNCADWNQRMGLEDAKVCVAGDGIAGGGAWTSSGHPNGDEITTAANNPAGGGGKGFRHWRCDGSNCNGGGLNITLPATYTELWIRWYMRYQTGFTYSPLNYTKELYLQAGGPNSAEIGFHSSDRFGPYVENPGRYVDGSPGWTTTMRGSQGDGQWHCLQVHVKAGQGTGLIESWIDGVPVTPTYSDVNWGTSGGWNYFLLGSNQATPTNGGDAYTDYDDIAVSNAGFIPCNAGGLPPARPAAPTNLRIVR